MSETIIGGGSHSVDDKPRDPKRRQYFAIWLTPDEAQYLSRRARNHRDSCCSHLDCLHAEGRTSTGGIWRNCHVDGCGCIQDSEVSRTDCWVCGHDPVVDRIATRQALIGVALGALACGLSIGWWLS